MTDSGATDAPSSADSAVVVEPQPNAVVVVLNRPGALNALDPELVTALATALADLTDDPRPLVLTGAGRAFCAGGDLHFFLSVLDDPDVLRAFFDSVKEMLVQLSEHPAPTIAAVNGAAVAGGLELVGVCDLAVAADDAALGDGHLGYGLVPGGGNSRLLDAALGRKRASWLLLSGELMPASEALGMGLVNRVVPPGELLATALAMADQVAGRPEAVRVLKRLIGGGLGAVLDTEQRELLAHFANPSVRQGLQRFAEGGR